MEYRAAGDPANPRTMARELAKEMPIVGLSENELADLVARYAAHLGVPLELESAG
jgi:hypothetical protein